MPSSPHSHTLLSTFFEALERKNHPFFYSCDWRTLIQELCERGGTDSLRIAFVTQWVTHGAVIRAQTQDDQLLLRALRGWLPKYYGDEVILYRGESTERATSNQYGLCWTTKVEVASMFASGLNAVRPAGGVLLRAFATREAILTGPGTHSNYLGEAEHTVDPSMLSSIEIVERFQPSDRRPLNT